MSYQIRKHFPFLLLATACVYLQVVGFGMIQLDDPHHIFENQAFLPPSLLKISRFWVEPFFGMYIPFTYTVWGAISFFTLHPAAFHLANFALHFGSGLLVAWICFYLLKKQTSSLIALWGSLFGSLIFLWHPVQAESVAWISGMKDVLFGFLLLLAIQQNLSGYENKQNRSTYLAYFFFFLALASKPTAVIGPLILTVLYRFFLSASWKEVWNRTRYWWAMLIPFALAAKWQQSDSVVQDLEPIWTRPWVAIDTLLFYLSKVLLPLGLGLDYGRSPHWLLSHSPSLIGFWPVLVLILAFVGRKQAPWLASSLLLFVIGFLPVSGLIAFQYQLFSTTADRYLYFSMLGIAIAVAFSFAWIAKTNGPRFAFFTFGLLSFLCAALGFQQTSYWKDDDAVFQRAIAINEKSFLAHNNYAFYLYHTGRVKEAIDHFSQVTLLRPKNPDLRVNLASSLAKGGNLKDAIREFENAIEIEPKHINANFHLGRILFEVGRSKEGLKYLERTASLAPENQAIQDYLNRAKQRQGEK